MKSCKALRLCRAGEAQPGAPRGFQNSQRFPASERSTWRRRTRISCTRSSHRACFDGLSSGKDQRPELSEKAIEDALNRRICIHFPPSSKTFFRSQSLGRKLPIDFFLVFIFFFLLLSSFSERVLGQPKGCWARLLFPWPYRTKQYGLGRCVSLASVRGWGHFFMVVSSILRGFGGGGSGARQGSRPGR